MLMPTRLRPTASPSSVRVGWPSSFAGTSAIVPVRVPLGSPVRGSWAHEKLSDNTSTADATKAMVTHDRILASIPRLPPMSCHQSHLVQRKSRFRAMLSVAELPQTIRRRQPYGLTVACVSENTKLPLNTFCASPTADDENLGRGGDVTSVMPPRLWTFAWQGSAHWLAEPFASAVVSLKGPVQARWSDQGGDEHHQHDRREQAL